MAAKLSERVIESVLVANRGEIAVRVIRACRESGVRSVAVYGDGDEQAMHVELAADAWRIPDGEGLPYLRSQALIEVAKQSGADAIHPGYGFLSENGDFAEAVEASGLIFIGPDASTIRAMGDKVAARRIATEAGVGPVPGSDGPVKTIDDARIEAERIGYPIAVKASGGGGGRGFRVARSDSELEGAFSGSKGEAERYFANPAVYLERYLEHPRHIEAQVFGDAHGTVIAMGERDCSIQRRHQKLVEEAPSPAVTPEVRARLLEASEALARRVGYVGAGTIEYLLDEDGSFFFLEMNTRIQVEHTVTEMVTGIDLVKEQLRVAQGSPLSFGSEVRETRGWAVECRINAEDPGRDFAPMPGMITAYREPAGFGVRVDSAISPGATINERYDSMIAKLVTWGRDRSEALARMDRCLRDYQIEGVPTTIPYHLAALREESFVRQGATTTFVADHPELIPPPFAGEARQGEPVPEAERMVIEVNGRRFDVAVHGTGTLQASAASAKRKRPGRTSGSGQSAPKSTGDNLVSPIQGTVIRVAVEEGASVAAGDVICVVEAMKMENELSAHKAGVVSSLTVEVGGSVKVGDVVATITGE
ncbi:MAG: acetyl-CoA carboxylase biotin carboxylase subunit [Chloroflexia bacterium]|nr:acetyl-CoA carboxylase biotin carboxylase subunit [Chloroflexia bacterium]